MVERAEGLSGVGSAEYRELPLSESLEWFRHCIQRFVEGGIYLIAGQPGIGKSTLGIQVCLDLGRRGIESLYILTEQRKEDLKQRALLMTASWPSKESKLALDNVKPEEGIYDVESLPSFLSQEVINERGKYHNVKFIVVDSIQGHGQAASATRKYRQIYEFCRQCKSSGKTVLLVAHVTKKGEIAGPKDMEHNVDCVLVMRKAMSYRPMFVPKNRFGPATFKPIPLEMDRKSTMLKISPHIDAVSSVAKTYLGQETGLAEAQAAVSLPNYGSQGKIVAPGLPRREIEQLTTCIAQMPDMEMGDLEYTIQCRLPGERRYRGVLGLSVCMALIASYIQRSIPSHHVYIGEVDLLRRVRELPIGLVESFIEALKEGRIPKPLRVFVSSEAAEFLKAESIGITVIKCDKLDDAVYQTWPELRPS